jgi:hypothetical protein
MDNEFRRAILDAIVELDPDNTSTFRYNDGNDYLIKYIATVYERDGSDIRMYWLYQNRKGLYQLHIDSSNEITIALDLQPFDITLPGSQQGGRRRNRRKTNRRRHTRHRIHK